MLEEGLFFWNKNSHNSDNLSDHLVGETGAWTRMMSGTIPWPGLLRTLVLYINLNLMTEPLRWIWTSQFCFVLPTLRNILILRFSISCDFKWTIDDPAPNPLCLGADSDPSSSKYFAATETKTLLTGLSKA